MREIQQIGDYSKGMVVSVDATDIPNEACVLATNLEPAEGFIGPLKEPQVVTSTAGKGLGIKDFGYVVKTDTTKSIVCQDGDDIKYAESSTTFANTLTSLETAYSTDIIPYNREARIAKGSANTKIFRHSDFYSLGLKNAQVSISKCNTSITDDNAFYDKMIYVRGTPSASMTIFIPAFSIDSIVGATVNIGLGSLDVETIDLLKAIKDASATPKKIVIVDATRALEILSIDQIDISDPYAPFITTLSTPTTPNPRSCFIYAGSTYNGNPAVVTKIGSSYTAYMVGNYNRNIGNGIYLWTRGAFETTISTVTESRILNAICVITVKDYLYEDISLTAAESNFEIGLTQSGGTTGYFATGTTYQYKWSLVYDGFQEGSLSTESANISGSDDDSVAVVMRLTSPYTLSRRVSGLNVYRREIKNGISSLYRLVTFFDLTLKDTGFLYANANNTYNSIDFSYTDSGAWSASYESITGLSEDLVTVTPQYKYGVIAYNRLLTIGNTITGEEEISKSLLMSEPFKFDVFNWDLNKIILPSTPKGIGYFRDKVYVFGDNVIWKCNIETLAIEDTYTGYQLLHNRSILVTDMGLLFATTTGVYAVDGTSVVEISYAIRNTDGVNSGVRSASKAWNYNTVTSRVYLYHMQDKEQILIFDTYTETGWIYSLKYKSWWYLDFGNASTKSNSCLIPNELGYLFFSTGTEVRRLFNGSNYSGFTWISKLFSNDTVSQKKKLYYVKHNSENYATNGLQLYIDNSSSASVNVGSDGDVTDTVYKTLQIKFSGTAGTTKRILKDIELIFRRMKGLR